MLTSSLAVAASPGTVLQPAPLGPTSRKKLGLCTWSTLRYESPHLLPWVAHHLAAGFDHVFVINEDISPSWPPNALHDAQLQALRSAENVTLVSMANDVGADEPDKSTLRQQSAIDYCNKLGVELGFAWMSIWDVDEYVTTRSQPLRDVLQGAADAGATGLLTPRVNMDPTAPTALPPADGQFETEAFKLRLGIDVILGKPMWRPTLAQAWNAHGVMVERAQDAVMLGPHGVLVLETEEQEPPESRYLHFTPASTSVRETSSEQTYNQTSLDGGNPPLALAHYIHRSSAECVWKLTCKNIKKTGDWRIVEGKDVRHAYVGCAPCVCRMCAMRM